ncbi:hypothetical protein BaRGS_00001919, partial [Batillaria attramentaria]
MILVSVIQPLAFPTCTAPCPRGSWDTNSLGGAGVASGGKNYQLAVDVFGFSCCVKRSRVEGFGFGAFPLSAFLKTPPNCAGALVTQIGDVYV